MSNLPHAFMACRGACGSVPLTEQEFDKQLFNFGKAWYCPRCGGKADLDKERTAQAEVALFMESLNA